jgi:coenzyme F420 hydrogenase subunit beta
MAHKTIADVVAATELCSSCGACAGACPTSGLRMTMSNHGDLVPELVGACLDKCSLCISGCPFSSGLYDPRPLNRKLFGSEDSGSAFHENVGWNCGCLAGAVRSKAKRSAAASGGLVTWCLETLLQQGLVDKVAVVKFDPRPNGSLFRFMSTSDPATVADSSGSVYHPVDISDVLREILNSPLRWAVVGVPCLCTAIRQSRRASARVRYLFGLACGMYQNTMYTEFLLARSGISRGAVGRISYREKRDARAADDPVFRAYGPSGEQGRAVHYDGEPYFLGRHGHFRLAACDSCMDVFAETADAAFMDAWLPDFMKDMRGTSIVIMRSQKVRDLFEAGRTDGSLDVAPLEISLAARSQNAHIRRKQELIRLNCPSAPVRGDLRPPTRRERIHFQLQKLTQRYSRRAWAHFGRALGPLGYWLSMAPLAASALALDQTSRITSLATRAFGRLSTGGIR